LARVGLLGGMAALAGCSSQPQVTASTISDSPVTTDVLRVSPVVSTQTQVLSPDEMRQISEPDAGAPYVLGPDDIIQITVYEHPELSAAASASTDTNNTGPTGGATSISNGSSDILISSDGTVQMPLIGVIPLGGMTLAQAKRALTSDYAPYVSDPDVTINVIQPQSMRYYLLGAFAAPGIKYPNHPLTLLEALALGGSVDIPNADLYQAYVAQGNVKLPVDLYQLLIQGDLSQNITLAAGDSIVIPSSANENAFVFGAVTKPGAVLFSSGHLSLLQALSVAGMDLPSYTDARLSQIRVIRAGGRSAEFFVVNAAAIMNGQAGTFDLRPGDIVFVPPTQIATWNQAIGQLIPSLQAISDALNPFVSITYLSRNGNVF
jgi:polysaccharide export outer membrane protein